MTPKTLIRLVQALVLAAALARRVTPAVALAGSSVPDAFERFAAAHPYGQGVLDQQAQAPVDRRSPDTLAAASAVQTQATDGRSPDTRDAATVSQPAPASIDLRSPDTFDATQPVQPVAVAPSSGFDWGGDASVGAAIALLALLAATGVLWLRRRPRHQMQTT